MENVDYTSVEISTLSGGSQRKEHIIKLDIAKEMAMLEKNEKGKQVRRYFIQVEKKYRQGLDTSALSPQTQAIIRLELNQSRQEKEIRRVDNDLQNFKQDIPLFGSEGDEITKAVRAKGTVCLGGRKSAAYNDNSIRSKVYSDIYKQLYREFGVTTYKAIKRRDHKLAMDIISGYEPPYILQKEIYTANQQMAM